MTYEELCNRLYRAFGVSDEQQATCPSLVDLAVALCRQQFGFNRAMLAETLAREMAEYIEQHKTVNKDAAKAARVH